jgi:hypothetical protein
MLRKVLSIVSLVIAGFFLHCSVAMAFIQVPSFGVKLATTGMFLIPMLLTLFIGLALRSFTQWQRVSGVVLISTAIVCAFLFLTIVCMLYSPELKSVVDQEAWALFSDTFSGVSFFLLVLLSGAALFYKGNST